MNKEIGKKGMELPMSAIIVLGLSMFVLITISAFFLTSWSGGMDKNKAERIFADGCLRYCDRGVNPYTIVGSLEDTDSEFLEACEVKGVQWITNEGEKYPILCLKMCQNCDLSPSGDLETRLACKENCYRYSNPQDVDRCERENGCNVV